MKNFFCPHDADCSCSSEKMFYLYDDANGSPIYMKENKLRADCTPVSNEDGKTIILRPVDHGIYSESDELRCDAFLHDVERQVLCFVEMKSLQKNWIEQARDQLRATVEAFNLAHPSVSATASRRRAYAANSVHPQFKFSQRELMARFHRETGFNLRIENKVVFSS